MEYETTDSKKGETVIEFVVFGVPRPQGSMRLHSRGDKTVARYADNVYEWRGLVTAACREAVGDAEVHRGPVELAVVFDLPRPKGHFRTGKFAGELKESAPAYPAVAPDTDKLLRAIGDAITDAGNVWHDDAQVCRIVAEKRYVVNGYVPGIVVRVRQINNQGETK